MLIKLKLKSEEEQTYHTSEKRLMMRSECLRRIRNARQQRFLYVSKVLLSCRVKGKISEQSIKSFSFCTSPPMTHTKSGVRTNGAHSLLKPCVEEKRRDREMMHSHCFSSMWCGLLTVNLVTMMYLMLPRKWPKSMWKRLPDVVTMMLSL